MAFARTFTTDDKAVKFDFSFQKGEGGELLMDISICWSYRPEDTYKMSRRNAGGKLEFDHFFQTGERVYGSIKGISFFDQSVTDNAALWGDFFYRYRNMDLGHFEGVMVSFPRSGDAWTQSEPHIPEPIDPPDSVDSGAAPATVNLPDMGPTNDRGSSSGDLFSYIYIHGWPELDPRDRTTRFLWYKPGTSASGDNNLFQTLTDLKQAKASREDMVAAARAYVEKENESSTSFFSRLYDLKPPLAHFASACEKGRGEASPGSKDVIGLLNGQTQETLKTYLESTEYQNELHEAWQSWFALVVLAGYRVEHFQHLTLLLTFANVLEAVVLNEQTTDLDRLLWAHVVLPSEVFPLPPYKDLDNAATIQGLDTFAIGDLQMVRQSLDRYEAGEIAYIVNLMQGERKEVVRRKRHLQQTVEEHGNRRGNRQENGETENNQNLRKEVKTTMCKHALDHAYNGFDTSYGPPTTAKLDGSYTVTISPEEPGSEERTRFAREIISRTANRISERVSQVRTTTILQETEEVETSTYDNSQGNGPMIGVFRWVNKVYSAHVVNYGSRLLLEMVIDQPASHYEGGISDLAGKSVYEPEAPYDLGLTSYTVLNEELYAKLAARYELEELEPPPSKTRMVTTTLQSEAEKNLNIPEGYQAQGGVVTCVIPKDMANPDVQGIVGSSLFQFTESGSKPLVFAMEEDSIPMALLSQSNTAKAGADGSALTTSSNIAIAGDVVVTVEVACQLSSQALAQWQVRAYRSIIKAYETVRERYNKKVGITKDDEADPLPKWAEIERHEIRKGCLQILLNHYQDPSPHVEALGAGRSPGMVFRHNLESMLEWDEFSYTLHADWSDRFAEDGDGKGTQGDSHDWSRQGGKEGSFPYFLQAQFARVLLPVKPAYNLAILYFLNSGTLWLGPSVEPPVHEADVTLVNELKRLPQDGERIQGNPWEFSIPTTMQILHQGDLTSIAHTHKSQPEENPPPTAYLEPA